MQVVYEDGEIAAAGWFQTSEVYVCGGVFFGVFFF